MSLGPDQAIFLLSRDGQGKAGANLPLRVRLTAPADRHEPLDKITAR